MHCLTTSGTFSVFLTLIFFGLLFYLLGLSLWFCVVVMLLLGVLLNSRHSIAANYQTVPTASSPGKHHETLYSPNTDLSHDRPPPPIRSIETPKAWTLYINAMLKERHPIIKRPVH